MCGADDPVGGVSCRNAAPAGREMRGIMQQGLDKQAFEVYNVKKLRKGCDCLLIVSYCGE